MPVQHAEPSTFTILTSEGAYAIDGQRAYWYGVEIPGASPTTFRVIQQPYAIDANQAYAGIMPFAVHSLIDFEVLSVMTFNRPFENRDNRMVIVDPSKAYVSGWSRDGFAYYWGATELEGADYDSVVILNDCYAKDMHRVYFDGMPIRGADVKSFEVVGSGSIFGRDKNYEYENGQRVGPVKK